MATDSTVRFVLGRSGSGKSYYCLEALRGELARQAEGSPLILLVPEQATFQMEQALLEGRTSGGFHRVRVMSFARLARQILLETVPPGLPGLTELARQMILRRLLQEHQRELTIFSRSGVHPGFVAQLSGMLSELHQYHKTPEQLRRQSQHIRDAGDPVHTQLAEKLADLAVLYQAYQDYIEDRFIDPDEYLDRMCRQCQEAEILREGRLWMDGFAGFTPQQYHVLGTILPRLRESHITLCLDPHSEQYSLALTGDAEQLDDTDLFHPILQTCHRLRRLLAGAPVQWLAPLLLPAESWNKVMPRFAHSPQLSTLEQNLFQNGGPLKKSSRPARLPPTAALGAQHRQGSPEGDRENIFIVEAANRRREVDGVAEQILRLCRDEGYRFREIAVILRGFSEYQQLIEASFADYGIAYFLDQRRSVRHHPLIELIRSLFDVLLSDFASEYVLNYLKTDLAPLERTAVDALENYVLAHGIECHRWYEETPWPIYAGRRFADFEAEAESLSPDYGPLSVELLNEYRRQAIEQLLQMRQSLYGDRAVYEEQKSFSVETFTAALLGVLEGLKVGRSLADWHRQAEQGGDPDEALIHQQVYGDLMALLDDVVNALADTELTLAEYAEILTSALSQMTLALVPPALDQVLVGNIERSRHPHIRAAFVLGVNEGVFPRVVSPDAFFSEAQRDFLCRDGFELAPTATEQLLHERYLAYIAFTRPRDFLWVSYPLADDSGSALNPSCLIESIAAAVGPVTTIRLPDRSEEPDEARIATAAQLTGQLAVALAPLREGREVEPLWKELFHGARAQTEWAGVVESGLAGLTYQNSPQLDSADAEGLFGDALSTSVSRLESFAACPFQHFARYCLKLQRRDELQLNPMNMGSYFHLALERVFQRFQSDRLGWNQLSDDTLDAIVGEVAGDIAAHDRQVAEMIEQSHRNDFLFSTAADRLRRFCRSLRAAARMGEFCQQRAELEFGPGQEVPELRLELPGGRQLLLHGKIDRIDTALGESEQLGLCVVEYKSTPRSFSFTQFYYGLSLQLISYLMVLQGQFRSAGEHDVQPAAALYMPIIRPGESHDEPPSEEILDALNSEQDLPHRAGGIIAEDWINVLDRTVGPGQRSDYFRFALKQDGAVSDRDRSGIVSGEEMAALLEHCRKVLVRLAGSILDGDIQVSPYRLGNNSPCSYCEFHSVCRFDYSSDTYRFLRAYNKPETFERIRNNHTE